MSQFGGFNTSYMDSLSSTNSDTIPASGSSNSDTTSGVPIIKQENVDDMLNRSADVRKQLSQSFQNAGSGLHISGGINKPQSRKGSIINSVRSNNASDDEDDDNNNHKSGDKKEIPKPDMVTSKIQELLTLIPIEEFQDIVKNKKSPIKSEANDDELDEDEDENGKTTGTKDGKPNKGQILTKSLEYIDTLQKLIDDNNHAEATLKAKLRELEKQANLPPSELSLRPTSGERALGEIGIGGPSLTENYYKQVLVASANTNKAAQRRGSTT